MTAENTDPESGNSFDRSPGATGASGSAKKWRLVVIACVIATGVLICILAFQILPARREKGNTDAPPGDDRPAPRDGPWGQLEYAPIVIAPPLEYAAETSDDFSTPVVWHFPGLGSKGLSSLFRRIGLPAALAAELESMSRSNASLGGMSIHPPAKFVLGLSRQSRLKLYAALCDYMQNGDQQKQFAFRGTSPNLWFSGSKVSPATRALVEPLIYQRRGFMYFADLRSIVDKLKSRNELLNLVKTLSREATFIVHLKVSAESDIESLIEYWGRGGRTGEIRPIIESLAQHGEDQVVDIMHLLPQLPRQLLYTYQSYSDADIRRRRDCHWTSINFFMDTPDDRFCDPKEVIAALRKDYRQIQGDLLLGDIALVLDANEMSVHSGVYIADDIFFHRCGPGASAAWTLALGEDLLNYYPRSQRCTIRYYRRKDL